MSFSLSVRQAGVFVLVSLAAFAGCSDSTGTPVPKSVGQNTNSVAEDTVGTVVTPSPTFVVNDEAGNAIGGVAVSIAVTAGGGTLADAATKSGSGPTPVGTWKLGNIAGINSLTVTVGGLPPLVISVTGKPGPPAAIVFVTGGNQSAPAGSPVPVAPVAEVRDQFGNSVPGALVTFTVTEGEGSVATTSPVATNASGKATAPQWTLGKSAVPQALQASASPGVVAAATATVATSYSLDVRFFGPPMPPTTGGMFTAAAARIRGAVTGDVFDVPAAIPGYNLESNTIGCGVVGLPTNFSEPIDDLLIFASVGPIDGPNNVLAFSFPCGVRDAPNEQTFIGIMKFDADDMENMIARGNLIDVIQHEMLHIVGVGTLWSTYNVIVDAGTPQTRYTGTLGVNGCISIGGSGICPSGIPLEPRSERAGPGTADAHWSEDVFFNELMTGFVNTRNSVPTGLLNPMSVMTVMSLGDLGYVVNANAADPYSIPGTFAAGVLGQLNVGTPGPPWEQVQRPKLKVSRSGRVSRIPQQQ